MPQSKFAKRKSKHTLLYSITGFSKIVQFMRYVGKYCIAGQTTITMWRLRIACWTSKATNAHSEYVTGINFPLQQRLYECVSMLRFTYTVSLAISYSITSNGSVHSHRPSWIYFLQPSWTSCGNSSYIYIYTQGV